MAYDIGGVLSYYRRANVYKRNNVLWAGHANGTDACFLHKDQREQALAELTFEVQKTHEFKKVYEEECRAKRKSRASESSTSGDVPGTPAKATAMEASAATTVDATAATAQVDPQMQNKTMFANLGDLSSLSMPTACSVSPMNFWGAEARDGDEEEFSAQQAAEEEVTKYLQYIKSVSIETMSQNDDSVGTTKKKLESAGSDMMAVFAGTCIKKVPPSTCPCTPANATNVLGQILVPFKDMSFSRIA